MKGITEEFIHAMADHVNDMNRLQDDILVKSVSAENLGLSGMADEYDVMSRLIVNSMEKLRIAYGGCFKDREPGD